MYSCNPWDAEAYAYGDDNWRDARYGIHRNKSALRAIDSEAETTADVDVCRKILAILRENHPYTVSLGEMRKKLGVKYTKLRTCMNTITNYATLYEDEIPGRRPQMKYGLLFPDKKVAVLDE